LSNATVNKHAKYHMSNFDEAVYYQYQMLILSINTQSWI